MSYLGHSLERKSYPSAEMQLVDSTAPADRAAFPYVVDWNNKIH